MRALFITFLFFSFCCRAAAEEEPLPDFLTLRDPFLPALPREEIIKTPVELGRQNDNNTSQRPGTGNVPAGPTGFLPVAVPPKKKPPSLQLDGIVWGSEHPQAIVDNAVVGVGDEISGVKIYAIKKDEIVVLFEGDKFHVRMEQ
ncbi:MAG: hypothetical protein HY591_03340 [Candidatus Omnitrophica bacterium]|nr:hypothetical protein [Candidatus Omnitrophota bacterium]